MVGNNKIRHLHCYQAGRVQASHTSCKRFCRSYSHYSYSLDVCPVGTPNKVERCARIESSIGSCQEFRQERREGGARLYAKSPPFLAGKAYLPQLNGLADRQPRALFAVGQEGRMVQVEKSQAVGVRNILIVDDDPDMCQLLADLFSAKGYVPTYVYNGHEAVDCVEAINPDIVILDVMMPDMDGWETYRQVRAMSEVPVLFLTALSEGGSTLRARSSDVFDTVHKPFSPGELLARTEALFEYEKAKIPPTHLGEEDRRIRYESNVAVVIPAYNEERFIGSVVLMAHKYAGTIIVVDDGSTDATAEVAEAAGAIVVSHEHNQGYGAAIETAFSKVRQLEVDAVVLIDADGQHSPEHIPALLEPILTGRADMVVGSRYIRNESGVPLARKVAHKFVNRITNLGSGISVSDSQCGYRAFSKLAISEAQIKSGGMAAASEFQFLANHHKWRVEEVPVTIFYDDEERVKRSLLKHGLEVVGGIIQSIGQARPLFYFGVPGMFLLLAGLAFGVRVVDIYHRSLELAIGSSLFSLLLSIFGLVMFSTGIILHSVRGLLIRMLKSK